MSSIFRALANPKKAFDILTRRATNLIKDVVPDSKEKLEKDAHEYWNKSSKDEVVEDMSHWLGVGRWSDKELWESLGKYHYDLLTKLESLTGFSVKDGTMIEWGPGGGANLYLFANHFNKAYGVDISKPNLDECEKQLVSRGINNFTKAVIDASEPEKVKNTIQEKVDFFLCTAVYQHFPGKEYGSRITNLAFDLLKDKGLAIIQPRYDDNTDTLKAKDRNYHKNVITFTSYRIDEFWNHLVDVGFKPHAIILQPEVKYAFYLVSKGL